MKCIVRIRKNKEVNVFVPKKIKAVDLMRELWEKELISMDSEPDADQSYFEDTEAVAYTITDNYTEFYIRELVEVERDDNWISSNLN